MATLMSYFNEYHSHNTTFDNCGDWEQGDAFYAYDNNTTDWFYAQGGTQAGSSYGLN